MIKEKKMLLKQFNKILNVLEETRGLINPKFLNKDLSLKFQELSWLVSEEKDELDAELFYEREELDIENLTRKAQ
jgi:hypothetical protein